jgi:hypothetical protein
MLITDSIARGQGFSDRSQFLFALTQMFQTNKYKCPFCGGQFDWERLLELIKSSPKLLWNLLKPPDKELDVTSREDPGYFTSTATACCM